MKRSSARFFRVEKITDEFLDGLGQTFGADVPVLSENGVKLSDVEMACAPAKCSKLLYKKVPQKEEKKRKKKKNMPHDATRAAGGCKPFVIKKRAKQK